MLTYLNVRCAPVLEITLFAAACRLLLQTLISFFRPGACFLRDALLAFCFTIDDMQTGRLVVDEPLANRVRSGRKQP